MVDAALVLSCLLLGLAGAPHCAAMCGPSCAAVICSGSPGQARASGAAFQVLRVVSYALAGALASAGVGAASLATAAAPALRPFWVLLHCAALALGLWMAFTARQPGWMMRLGTTRPAAPAAPGGWKPVALRRSTWTAAAAGASWVAWPCGLLQSALVVSALCEGPGAGALAMGVFALASAPGLLVTPWALGRLRQGRAGQADTKRGERLVGVALRVSGLALAGGALYALNRDAWHRFAAYCAG
jgi:hypothetical protein